MPYFLRFFCVAALLFSAAGRTQPPPAQPSAPPAAATEQKPNPAAMVGDRNATFADRLPPDQILQLEADQDKFIARYIPDLSGEPRGAVIVLHDSGQHPNWPFTVAALIDDLPLHGWSTIGIELPAPAQDPTAQNQSAPDNKTAPPATAPNATPTPPAATPAPNPATTPNAPAATLAPEQRAQARIAAALRYFTEQKQTNVVLIGFGSGAYRAAEFVRQLAAGNGGKSTAPITALALIAAQDKLPDSTDALPKMLPATELPALDLVLSSELSARAEAEQRRRAVLHQRKRIYQQLELPPLNGDVQAVHNLMVKRVRGFLQAGKDKEKTENGYQ